MEEILKQMRRGIIKLMENKGFSDFIPDSPVLYNYLLKFNVERDQNDIGK
jgi:hypothetical protein